MDDRDKEILLKILKHVHHAQNHCERYTPLEQFEKDDMCVEATVFNLMQIGELSKIALSDEAKGAIRNIPWKQLYGLRNRIVHGYDGVNLQIVWDTVTNDLPMLQHSIEAIIEAK